MKLSGTGFEHHSDECEISVQEQRFSGGVQGPAKPAVVGFTADKPASGSRPFECCTIDHSDNSPSISTGYPDDSVIQKSMLFFGRNLLGMWWKRPFPRGSRSDFEEGKNAGKNDF